MSHPGFIPIYLTETRCDWKKCIQKTLKHALSTEMEQYTLPYC